MSLIQEFKTTINAANSKVVTLELALKSCDDQLQQSVAKLREQKEGQARSDEAQQRQIMALEATIEENNTEESHLKAQIAQRSAQLESISIKNASKEDEIRVFQDLAGYDRLLSIAR